MKINQEQDTVPTEKTLIVKHGGLIISLIFIALFMLLIGLFHWQNQTNPSTTTPVTPERPTAETNREPESTTARAQTDSFNAMSTSDEISTIEADLESTNLDTLDVELNAIEAELKSN